MNDLFRLLELPGDSACDDPLAWDLVTNKGIRERASAAMGSDPHGTLSPWRRRKQWRQERQEALSPTTALPGRAV